MKEICRILVRSVAPVVLAVCLLASCAWGQESTEPAGEWDMGAQGTPGMWSLVAQLILSLALIGVLLWGVLYVIKRFSRRTLGTRFGGGLVEVLERAYIGPKKAIYLVRIGSKIAALGVTDSEIRVLLELPPEETLELLSTAAKEEARGRPDFLQNLRARMGARSEGE